MEINLVRSAKYSLQLKKVLRVPGGNWQRHLLQPTTLESTSSSATGCALMLIATHRQLSVLHPIYKLFHPHFRDTMHINALARQAVLNAGGIVEKTVFPGPCSMELTSVAYRDWVFPEQALPAELVKRGVAIEDPTSKHGVRLLIEDYPCAVGGLEIWSAIRSWVQEYSALYYKSDDMVLNEIELQAWWKEVREAVNFGQYPYGGFAPNRPGMSRRLIPEPGSPEYEELKGEPCDGISEDNYTPIPDSDWYLCSRGFINSYF